MPEMKLIGTLSRLRMPFGCWSQTLRSVYSRVNIKCTTLKYVDEESLGVIDS